MYIIITLECFLVTYFYVHMYAVHPQAAVYSNVRPYTPQNREERGEPRRVMFDLQDGDTVTMVNG